MQEVVQAIQVGLWGKREWKSWRWRKGLQGQDDGRLGQDECICRRVEEKWMGNWLGLRVVEEGMGEDI